MMCWYEYDGKVNPITMGHTKTSTPPIVQHFKYQSYRRVSPGWYWYESIIIAINNELNWLPNEYEFKSSFAQFYKSLTGEIFFFVPIVNS